MMVANHTSAGIAAKIDIRSIPLRFSAAQPHAGVSILETPFGFAQ
jgi:hypothetical protein